MSAAQLAERDKPKSLAPPTPQVTAATPPPISAHRNPTSRTRTWQEARPRHSWPAANCEYLNRHDLDELPKGARPLPATGAEFAAQVLKSLTSTPPSPPPQQLQTPSTPAPAPVASTKLN